MRQTVQEAVFYYMSDLGSSLKKLFLLTLILEAVHCTWSTLGQAVTISSCLRVCYLCKDKTDPHTPCEILLFYS